NRQGVHNIPQRRGLDEQYPLELPGGHARHHRDFGDWRGVRAQWPCRTAALTQRETKYATVTPLARPAQDPLDDRRDAMPRRLIAQDLLAVDPVHLNRAARPDKWLMAMPGMVAAPEADQSPIFWRHFDDEVIEIRARAEQPEAAACPLPSRVHVDQYGDDLACRVGMDLTVLLRATAPHREHDRPATQVDSELALERLPHVLPSQLIDQGSERRTVRQSVQREATGQVHPGEAGVDRSPCLDLHEARHHEKIEGVPTEFRGMKRCEIKHRHAALILSLCLCNTVELAITPLAEETSGSLSPR